MMVLLKAVALVSTACLVGGIAFFSTVMAPLVFSTLDAATAGRLIRAVFPWYYLFIIVASLIGLLAFLPLATVDAVLMALVAASALYTRQILMPRIDRYRDAGLEGDAQAEAAFARLHRRSVWINGGQLLAAVVVLIRFAL